MTNWHDRAIARFGSEGHNYPIFDCSMTLLEQIDPGHLTHWLRCKKEGNACLLMFPYDRKEIVTISNKDTVQDPATALIRTYLSNPTATACLLRSRPRLQRPWMVLAVDGITHEQKEDLLTCCALSQDGIAYFFFPIDCKAEKLFLGFLKGFTGLNDSHMSVT
jgi:hypothetical protein